MKIRLLCSLAALVASLSACNDSDDSNPYFGDTSLVDPARERLVAGCVVANSVPSACTLRVSPLIGMEFDDPSVDNIMSRVYVSHEWMRTRFREIVVAMPDDLRVLMKPLTAVVIGADIRPSYYSPITAAIYLDPATLWLTDDEKATISQEEDYRSGFSDPLSFRSPWRYVHDDAYAWRYFPLDAPGSRTLNDILFPMAQLLYHELAHANDYIPPSQITSLDTDLSPYEAMVSIEDYRLSDLLTANWRLTSETMRTLANVAFRGIEPSEALAALTGAQVGDIFEADIANDFYSYSTPREDVAMLFEEVMLKYHFDLDRDMAFVTPNDNYTIEWGIRNRLGDELVKQRAEWLMDQILPEVVDGGFLDTFPPPTALPQTGWTSSVSFAADANAKTTDPANEKTQDSNHRPSDFVPPGGHLR